MNIKIFFAVVATIINTYAFFPYFRDVFLRKTQPHLYTWLIWFITQSTAVYAIFRGGGQWGAVEFIPGCILIFFVCIFSFTYGTKNIKPIDTILLILTLMAIVVWWQLNNPVLSIAMISLIDVLGYLPSYRKTYEEPWSETISTWIIFSTGSLFALLALSQYNFLTMSYIIATSVANILMVLICVFRRPFVKR